MARGGRGRGRRRGDSLLGGEGANGNGIDDDLLLVGAASAGGGTSSRLLLVVSRMGGVDVRGGLRLGLRCGQRRTATHFNAAGVLAKEQPRQQLRRRSRSTRYIATTTLTDTTAVDVQEEAALAWECAGGGVVRVVGGFKEAVVRAGKEFLERLHLS